jgi:hypothetical protein
MPVAVDAAQPSAAYRAPSRNAVQREEANREAKDRSPAADQNGDSYPDLPSLSSPLGDNCVDLCRLPYIYDHGQPTEAGSPDYCRSCGPI